MPTKLHGGEAPDFEASEKIMVLVHGYAGTGKSSLGLSFPAPFWVFNLDRSIGSLTKQLPATHEITLEAPVVDEVDKPTPAMAQKILASFDALMTDAIKSKSDGTVIVDGWDLFWEIVKIAKVRNLEEDLPKEYAMANGYMNQWLARLGRSRLNVVFSVISSRVWMGAKTETERVRAEGFKHKDRWLTHEIYMFSPEERRTPNEAPRGGDPSKAGETGQSHLALVTMSKLNESLVNRRFPNLNFGLLYRLTFGQNYPEPDRLWKPGTATQEKEEGSATS